MPKQSNSLLIYVQVKQDIVKIEWYHIHYTVTCSRLFTEIKERFPQNKLFFLVGCWIKL